MAVAAAVEATWQHSRATSSRQCRVKATAKKEKSNNQPEVAVMTKAAAEVEVWRQRCCAMRQGSAE